MIRRGFSGCELIDNNEADGFFLGVCWDFCGGRVFEDAEKSIVVEGNISPILIRDL